MRKQSMILYNCPLTFRRVFVFALTNGAIHSAFAELPSRSQVDDQLEFINSIPPLLLLEGARIENL